MSLRVYDDNGSVISGEFGDLMTPNAKLIEVKKPSAFSFRDSWWGPLRIRGIYELGTARAELTADHKPEHANINLYKLEFTCKELKDGQDLYVAIRGGKIQPKTSYEEEQVQSTTRKFGNLCHRFWDFWFSTSTSGS